MLFNSIAFLCFFAAVLAVRLAQLPWTATKLLLLVASYAFYAAWYPPHLFIVLTSTCVDWIVAARIAEARSHRKRRALLLVSLTLNLGLLAVFKYSTFVVTNVNALAALLGAPIHLGVPRLLLPAGISFYTFEALSYTIEVYRGNLRPSRSLLDFGLFIAFFPRMVAGPVMRAELFLPQCEKRAAIVPRDLAVGIALFLFGVFEKVVLADWVLAPVSDRVFGAPAVHSVVDSWVGTLAFAGQIFFDFAGYSTCAIGGSRCMGFVLPQNFNSPYAARNFSEFWERWHISLSSWLRDYLYIPLGGSRRGRWRTLFNLALTMLLGGLWHGAAWTFVVWGALHGALLIFQRVFGSRTATHSGEFEMGRVLLTFAGVCLGWVFFRATSVVSGARIAAALCGWSPGGPRLVGRADAIRVVLLTVGVLVMHWRTRSLSLEDVLNHVPRVARVAALVFMLVLIVLSPGDNRAFIYFQF